MHEVAPQIEAAVGIPVLHIADATADRVKAAGLRRVGLLGTRLPIVAAAGRCSWLLRSTVILRSMTHRVGRKGQVVIPKAFRKAIRLEPGDEVAFSQEGNVLRLERVASPDVLMGRLAGHRLVEALEKDRRAERRR